MNKGTRISDDIFGSVTLKPYIMAIVDTPEFQRLRCIWQLGVTPFVYPTAGHSRFEHSIGTYWIASKFMKRIKKFFESENKEMKISEKDIICVEIAALCHDIGHGPFSNVWDKRVLPYIIKNEHISHDCQFKEIWNILKQNDSVTEMIKRCDLDDNDVKLIDAIIRGDMIAGKEILCRIVNNVEYGLDVAKLDYLARDSTYLGHSSTNFISDIKRLIHLAKPIKDGNEIWKIAFRDTEGCNIIRVFQLMHYTHQTAYQHRTVIAIELMLVDGVKQCIDKGILSPREIGNIKWILRNTDAVFWSNVHSDRFDNDAIFKRILCRKLYTPISEAVKYELVDDPKEAILEYLKEKEIRIINNIRLQFCQLKLIRDGTNPILKIPFYTKLHNEVFYYDDNTLPPRLNMNCNESIILVFSINTIEDAGFRKTKEALKEYFDTNGWIIKY